MKKHIISLFDPAHRWWTIVLFVASILLIITSQLVGITDNLPGIALLLMGMICLFFTVLHPWRKQKNYVLLAVVSIGFILLTFLTIHILSTLNKTEFISEGVVMGFIGLFCVPGFVVSIIGILILSNRSK